MKNNNKVNNKMSWVVMEPQSNVAIFTFGRFNPPTIGHQKMLQKILGVASEERGDPYIFVSHTQDKKKNPLSYDQKIDYMKQMFPEMEKFKLPETEVRTPFVAATYLQEHGYNKLIMVVGSDRVEGFTKMLGGLKESFEEIRVISAGDRDPDAEGLEGMSASKMRLSAKSGDLSEFQKGLPPTFDGKEMMEVVKSQLK